MESFSSLCFIQRNLVALEENDDETSSCLVQIYKNEHMKVWRRTTKVLSWLALDGGHANVLPFLWSARGSVSCTLVSVSGYIGRKIIKPFFTPGCCAATFVSLFDHSHIPITLTFIWLLWALCLNRKAYSAHKVNKYLHASFYRRFQSYE